MQKTLLLQAHEEIDPSSLNLLKLSLGAMKRGCYSCHRMIVVYYWLLSIGSAGWIGNVAGQEIPVGTWRVHASFSQMNCLVAAGKHLYAASTNGLMRYDLVSGTVETLDKTNGLTGNHFSALGWHSPSQTLIIGYTDGQIDLLTSEKIINIRTLATATLIGVLTTSRGINHILVHGNVAYLSLPFGIAVLDLSTYRLRETYLNLGEAGQTIPIFQTALWKDSLVAATLQGIRATWLSGQVNRMDFRSWRTVLASPGVRTVAAFGDLLLAGVNNAGVFRYESGRWTPLPIPPAQYQHIDIDSQVTTVSLANGKLVEWTLSGQTQIIALPELKAPRQSIRVNSLRYVADFENGLLEIQGTQIRRLTPPGPFIPQVRQIAVEAEQLIAFYGGFTANGLPQNDDNGFSTFSIGNWKHYNRVAQPNFPPATDWLAAARAGNQQLWLASFTGGLWLWQMANNRLERLNDAPAVRITGLAADPTGALWLTAFTSSSTPSVFRRLPQGMWRAYSLGVANGNNALAPVIDNAGNAWVRLNPATGGGLVIVSPEGRVRQLSTQRGQGALPSLNVLSLACDQQGTMWVGTDNGLVVFFDAASAINTNTDGQRIVFNLRELLRGEVICSIAIDGGNRKWIGTSRGVWLFSADGAQQIYHFTASNSPLLSDLVQQIAIHPQTGEVFFVTDKGLVSFRGTATEANLSFDHVRVFPNPVPPKFNGLISFDGLVAGAIVKITDAAGRLVYQTRAEGGRAVWNGLDYQGRATCGGVYLVYMSDAQGTERLVTKFVKVE